MPDKRSILYRISGILLLLGAYGCVHKQPVPIPPPPIAAPIPLEKPKLPVPTPKPSLETVMNEQNLANEETARQTENEREGPQDTERDKTEDDESEDSETVYEDRRKEFFNSLYQAHIFLSTFSRERSFDSLDDAGQFLAHIREESKNQYPIMTELTFLHHSTLSRIYIPMKRGPERFKEVARALALLNAKNLEAVDFRLVSYDFPYEDPNAARIIIDAKTILQDKTIRDESYAFLTAERELDKFPRLLMNIQPYNRTSKGTFTLNYLASRIFFDKGNYELSRIAFKQAKKGLNDYLSEHDYIQPSKVLQYWENMEQMERALNKKDPTILGKLDGWLSRLVNEDLVGD